MKTFCVERKHWTLFCNIYASISDKCYFKGRRFIHFLSYWIKGHVVF